MFASQRPNRRPTIHVLVLAVALAIITPTCGSQGAEQGLPDPIPDGDLGNELTLVAADDTSTTGQTADATGAPLSVTGSTTLAEGTGAPGDASTTQRSSVTIEGTTSSLAEGTPTSGSGTSLPAGSQAISDPASVSTTSSASAVSTATTGRPTTSTTASTQTSATTAPTTRTTATSTTATSTTATSTTRPAATRAVLIFSKTAGYRHPSIGAGIATMKALAEADGFTVTTSEDAGLFTDASLAGFDAVVFLSTSGDVLNGSQQTAFENFIGGGGGFVGVHAASDTEYNWPWYGGLIGAYFSDHPLVPNDEFVDCHCFEADVRVTNSHPSTNHLPSVWKRRDEWYNFRAMPTGVQVLLDLDESTYPGGTMGPSHPISWSHNYSGGRAWYTAMGHTAESFSESDFKKHLAGGLRWAAGQ